MTGTIKNSAVWILLVFWVFPTFVHAQTANAPQILTSDMDLLAVSAAWNGTPLSGTTTVPLDTNAPFTWDIGYDASNTVLTNYLHNISNATYTLQLYKGTIGNSLLVYSETIPNGGAETSGQFPFAFPGAGSYFLAYTATYPSGVTSLDFKCGGDICYDPPHLLSDFQKFMIEGETESPNDYGNPEPALFGLLQFSIAEPAGPHASNVLFLPGTMESRLYTKDILGLEHLLWEPTLNSDVPALALGADGSSINQVYTRDIVDYLYSPVPLLAKAVSYITKSGAVMYGPFISYMNDLVTNGTIREWKAYPYDWRYDASDIVKNGTLVASATGTPSRVYLQDVLQSLASSSPTGQVTIIAHSNGGLVAKELATQLDEEGRSNLIDRIIMVGTPQFGTPATIGNLLHGDNQTRALGLVTTGGAVRQVALTMSGPYDLLPSSAYFDYVSTPVVSFDDTGLLNSYRATYGDSINTESSFASFVTDAPIFHVQPNADDLQTPARLSPELLDAASTTHSRIDKWVPPIGLSLVSIVGMGQSTISGYDYSSMLSTVGCSLLHMSDCKKHLTYEHTPTITSQGDDTVVSISAGGNPGGGYYFASDAYEKDTGIQIVHQSLLNAAPIQEQIQDLLTNASTTEPYLSTQLPKYNIIPDDVVVSVHSPMNLLVTDTEGRQSGLAHIPGTDFSITKKDIPQSDVEVLDDEKYVYVPTGTYTIALQGYDTGLSTVDIGHTNQQGGIDELQEFGNVPTTASTTASFTLTDVLPSIMQIDTDGDGSIDLTASSTPYQPFTDDTSGTEASGETGVPNNPATALTSSSSSGAMKQSSANNVSGQAQDIDVSPLEIVYLQLKVKLLGLEIELLKLLHLRIARETTSRLVAELSNMRITS